MLMTVVESWASAASISLSIGLKARGVADKILSIRPWPWSVFASSFAAFNNCVEPRMLKVTLGSTSLVS